MKLLYTIVAALLLPVAAGCKTGSSTASLKDASDGGAGNLHCLFDSPVGSPELFEVWANASNPAQLADVKERYVSPQGAAVPTKALGSVSAVGLDVMTLNGQRGLRAYLKDVVSVNLKKFNCYSLENGGAGAAYLCTSKGANKKGGRDSLFVTNMSAQKYLKDLTVYRASCTAN